MTEYISFETGIMLRLWNRLSILVLSCVFFAFFIYQKGLLFTILNIKSILKLFFSEKPSNHDDCWVCRAELEGFEPSNAGYGLRGLEVIEEVQKARNYKVF